METVVFNKGKSYRYLYARFEDFRHIALKYVGNLDIEKCEYDYKIHKLNVGDHPSRLLWHYDGTNNPLTCPIVDYGLYLTGDAICPTEFFENEPEPLHGYQNTESDVHRYAVKIIETQWPKIYSIPYDIWNLYSNRNLHTATKCTQSGTRLLIRMKEK